MVLKVVDSIKGETSLISIKVFERHGNDLSFLIWDTSGDEAIVTVAVPSEIKKAMDDLYTIGKATVNGSLEWSIDEDEDEE